MRGYVGYKPVSAEERKRLQEASQREMQKTFKATPYSQIPQWLRDAHASQKQTEQPKPPSGG